jgi:hypothetical protein
MTILQKYNTPSLPQLDGGDPIFWRNQLSLISKSINQLVARVSAAISNAMLAAMPANTIKGNNTGGSTTPSDLTVAQTQTLLGIDTINTTLTAIQAAWTAYTPTVGAGGGALTTASATGRYLQIGKTIHVTITVTVTTNGTANLYVSASLPFTSNNNAVLVGREIGLSGKMLQGIMSNGSTFTPILNYDNTYPAADGAVLVVNGVYERT